MLELDSSGSEQLRDEQAALGGSSAAREELAQPAPEPVLEEGPPHSYIQALADLIGRLVEPDGTPVPDMGIEALAATVHDFLPELGSLFEEIPLEIDVVKGSTRTDEEWPTPRARVSLLVHRRSSLTRVLPGG